MQRGRGLTHATMMVIALGTAALDAACSSAQDSVAGDGGTGDPDATPSVGDASPATDSPSSEDASDAISVDAGGASDSNVASDSSVSLDAAPADAAAHADASATDANDAAPPSLGLDCSSDGGDAGNVGANGAPVLLGCTGLYSVWPSRTITPNVRAFDPGLHLWSDGADKSRWIQLPQGTQIDTSDMDEWTFPVGTKIWKEFRQSAAQGGKKIETRLLWKRTAGDWVRTTYAWSQDQTTATQLTSGALDVWGTGYEIPAQEACTTCHQGRIDGVLGFEAVSLASPGATGLTMAALVSAGLVTTPPSGSLAIPGNATEAAALGWLHANCGTSCHSRSPSSFAGTTGLWMRLDVARLGSVAQTDAFTTSVNVPSSFQPAPNAGYLRIKPGDVTKSAIPFRDGTRDDQGQNFQMPPIDSHLVDDAGVAAVKAWVAAIPP